MQIQSHCIPIPSWRRTVKVSAVIWLHGYTNFKGELKCIILDGPDGFKLRLCDLYLKIEDNYRPKECNIYHAQTSWLKASMFKTTNPWLIQISVIEVTIFYICISVLCFWVWSYYRIFRVYTRVLNTVSEYQNSIRDRRWTQKGLINA